MRTMRTDRPGPDITVRHRERGGARGPHHLARPGVRHRRRTRARRAAVVAMYVAFLGPSTASMGCLRRGGPAGAARRRAPAGGEFRRRPERSRSMRHPRRSSPGSCESATGAAVGTATTGSTTTAEPKRRAPRCVEIQRLAGGRPHRDGARGWGPPYVAIEPERHDRKRSGGSRHVDPVPRAEGGTEAAG